MEIEQETKLMDLDLTYDIHTDSQDVKATLDSIGYDEPDATGLASKQADGDFIEVWVTTSNRPWNLDSLYRRIK